MRGPSKILVLSLALAASFGTLARAAGPVDGEVGASWWASDYSVNTSTVDESANAGAPGFRAEVWLHERYGMHASMYNTNPDATGFDNSESTSVDLLWKAIAPKENNFFAVGMGWHQVDMGLADKTSGMRLSLEGQMGFAGPFYGYGEAAYLPSLGNTSDATNGNFKDLDGIELELGVAWKASPLISVRAGWRQSNLDYTQSLSGIDTDGSVDTKGFLAGMGVRF